jgi:hypothetical protein
MMSKDSREAMQQALVNGSVCIGVKNGMGVYVSAALLGEFGLQECKERLGLIKQWPVRTNLNGNIVMVEGETHEEAINRYLNRIEK